MDVRLLFAVVKRHQVIVTLGLFLAVALAFLAFVRVVPVGDGPTFVYRQAEEWASHTTLQVTESGFPEGRTVLPTETTTGATAASGIFADPGRLTGLASLYVNLVDSDPVRARAGRVPPRRDEKILATQLVSSDGQALPFLDIRSFAPTPARALDLVQRQRDAFISYIRDQQVQNKVPISDRVALASILTPTRPALVSARSKQLPAIVFLSVFAGVIALAFAVDGAQGRRRAERPEAPLTRPAEEVERSRWRDVETEEPTVRGKRSVA
jgi:hypothetical protein